MGYKSILYSINLKFAPNYVNATSPHCKFILYKNKKNATRIC